MQIGEKHAENQKLAKDVRNEVEKNGDSAVKCSFYTTLKANSNAMQNFANEVRNKTWTSTLVCEDISLLILNVNSK